MSDRERMYQLLDTVPDDKIAYVIGFIQGLTIERSETPNDDTVAAFEEGDKMLADGTGKRYNSASELFSDLEA